MSVKRMWAMIVARNREFFRDRAAFGWNFLFPFLLIGGFAVIFGDQEYKGFKVGVFPCAATEAVEAGCVPEQMADIRYVTFLGFDGRDTGLDRLKRHKIDMLVDTGQPPYRFWVNDSSPRGYVAERMIGGSLDQHAAGLLERQAALETRQVRYIDWLFPGILGMNIMFSALYGVGFVVVRYRKNGVLKRLNATPLTALEYLSAQMLSRIFLLLFTLAILWIGCDLVFDFHVEGHYLDIAILFTLGCLSLTALGLIVASRGDSEEFANGVLNFIAWPMMFLSEVWFSIEGAPQWVKGVSKLLPLTHLLSGVRKIMNDGAGLADVMPELTILAAMTVLFLVVGAGMFSWHK